MSRIGLIAVDSNYPNLALMKISRYHKQQGDSVEWYNPLCAYDKVYMAKVFPFTPDYGYYIQSDEVEKGGTGYDISKDLPDYIDSLQPDYSIYPSIDSKTAYGFLTRGCPNSCKWCIVPKKEGNIRPYMDVEEIAICIILSLINKVTTMCKIHIHESRKSKLKWKDIPKFKDSYRWPVVQVQEYEGSLHFKFSGGSKYSPNTYFTIEDYREYTALEIFNILVNIGFYTRHSHDAVLKFYHDRGLDLGFTRNFLKSLKA